MTTASSTNPIDSTTDVAFRAWGSDISAQLLAIGLTKTGDTGQVNWATVTVVGAYSSAVSRGYEIWAFNDPLQGTAPIVFKIEYGAAAAAQPVLWITVGTGSDGAGTITGAVKSTRQSITANVANYTSGLVSRFCYVPATGFLGMGLKLNGQGSSNGVFGIFIMRNNDTTGAATANGATLFMGAATGSNYSIQLNFVAGSTIPNTGTPQANPILGAWPYSLTSSFVGGGNFQALPLIVPVPALQVLAQLCVTILSEIAIGTTFALNVVGLTNRTFIVLGAVTNQPITGAATTYALAMVWE